MSDVAERVKKIVVEHLGVEAEKVTSEASFVEDLGADSLDTVELVMAFEEEFGIDIPDEDAEQRALVDGLRNREIDVVTSMEADMLGLACRERRYVRRYSGSGDRRHPSQARWR